MPTSIGDIFIECVRNPHLFEELDYFEPPPPPAEAKDALMDILNRYGKTVQSGDPALIALNDNLQNVGMRIWLHELRTWVLAHPAPSAPVSKGGNKSWQP